MKDDGKRRDEVTRGQEAGRIFSSDIFQEAILAVKNGIVREWVSSKPEERDLREMLHWKERALFEIAQVLKNTMETGKLASLQLSDEEARRNGDASRSPRVT